MQSNHNNYKRFLTEDEIDFILQAVNVANFDTEELDNFLHGDFEPFQEGYTKKNFMNNLRHVFTHPHNTTLDDLGEVLNKLPNMQRMRLLDYRPQLLNSFDDLFYILDNYIDKNNRLIFASHFIELIFDSDKNIGRHRIFMIGTLLNEEDKNAFLNFALSWSKRKRENNPFSLFHATTESPHANSFSASFLLSTISTMNHLLGGQSIVTTMSGLIAIAAGLHGLYKVYQEALEPGAFRHIFWHKEPTKPNLTRQLTL